MATSCFTYPGEHASSLLLIFIVAPPRSKNMAALGSFVGKGVSMVYLKQPLLYLPGEPWLLLQGQRCREAAGAVGAGIEPWICSCQQGLGSLEYLAHQELTCNSGTGRRRMFGGGGKKEERKPEETQRGIDENTF